MSFKATIVKVNEKTCDIKPHLKNVHGDYSIIKNVPVATSLHTVHFRHPLKEGDDVIVALVENATASGVHYKKEDYEKNLANSVIVWRFVDSIPKTDATIDYDGNLNINARNIKLSVNELNYIEVTPSGIKIVSNGIELMNVIDENAGALVAAQVLTINGPSSFTNLAQFTILKNTKTSVMKKT